MNPKKPLTREELTNKLFKHHGLIPTNAFNEIEANQNLKFLAWLKEHRYDMVITEKAEKHFGVKA